MSDRDEIKELKAEIKRLRKRLEEIDRGCWNCAIGKFRNEIEEKAPKLYSTIIENVCSECTDIVYRDHEYWVRDTKGNRVQETKKALETFGYQHREEWEEALKKWEEEHETVKAIESS